MLSALLAAGAASAFDHSYTDYGALLQANIRWSSGGNASTVDYTSLKRRQEPLMASLKSFSDVSSDEFARWTREQQMAFLINAYNAFTLDLVLSRYPDLKSIRDLGSLLSSPWKKSFFTLLGGQRALDWIEHEQLRPRYHDARVHFAVNCASIGCPALRPEPYVAERLDAQLDDQQRRYLTDRSRNRFNPDSGQLSVSSIFKWYGEDFDADGAGLRGWLSKHADLLGDDAASRTGIASGQFSIDFLSYDWSLNSLGPRP
jgi:hypothetical protein